MRLKTLEMQGFKSFPDKTVISFDRGITVVVGPNGSGKSNISDAMRWVLGEISSKNIRGSKMEDVIFAGSQKRSPMGYAEVSVTFDNTEEDGKIASMSDYDEITVTRRYYRVGESEYFINRKPVRLKDIHELFMNTGLGKGGYSIIGQGKISEIISSKSEDRRAIFEEAAGIAKYRYQKQEAEKKLSATLDNLVRLEDIESELESRIGPLEKESEKAKKYLALRDEKKALDLALSVFDIDTAKAESGELEKSLAASKNSLDRSDETLAELEKRDEELFSSLQSEKAESERAGEDISVLTEKIFAGESEIKLAENDSAHLSETATAAKAKIAEKKAALELAEEEKARHEKAAAESAKRAELLSERHEKAAAELKGCEDMISGCSEKVSALTDACERAQKEDVEAKIAASVAESQREANLKKCDGVTLDIAKHDDDISMLEKRIDRAKEKIAGYDKKLGDAAAAAKEISDKKEELIVLSRKLAGQKNDIFLEISQRKHRISNLLRMEELLEGYSRAVRFLMTEYRNGTVTDKNGDVPKIYGPVSQFVSVDEKYSAALEVAFGQSLQNIIVEDEDCAKAAIAFLKKRNAGRATFYPITTMSGTPVSGKTLGIENIEGYIAIASELVSCEEKFRGIADYLTGRIIVAKDMDSASVIARKLGFRYKTVTLDGQVINAGGSYTGGSVSTDSGMLSRRAQIDRLGAEVKSLEKDSAETETQIAENEKAIKDVTEKERSALGESSMIKTLRDAESTQMQVLSSQCDVLKEAREQLRGELSELMSLAKQEGKNAEDYIEKRRRLSEEIASAEKQLCDVNREKSEAEKAAEVKKTELSDCLIDIAREEKTFEMAQNSLAAANEKCESLESEIVELSSSTSDAERKIAENTAKIKDVSARTEALKKQVGEINSAKADISKRTLETERKLTEVRAKQKELTHTRELLFREFTNIESAYKRAVEKSDKLISFLWEEYETTYTQACELCGERITEKTRREAASKQGKLKSEIKALGDVHVGAIEEYKEVKTRYDELSTQTKDLRKSKEELMTIVVSLEERMREDFSATFEEINTNFGQVFRTLFGGGTAELKLTDKIDVLNSGIDINVAPPGKVIKNMSLLSGGEQAFVAIALYFAILKVTPSPFCILDEIEAALDEVNVDKLADYLKNYSERTQFVVITHRRGTMEAADRIYGVTMHEKGISDVLSIDVSEIEAKTGQKPV